MGRSAHPERQPWGQRPEQMIAAIQAAVTSARTFDEELAALVHPLAPDDREIILARWGVGRIGAPTLHQVGRAHGVTRERVRQIVTLHEGRLEHLHALPIGTRIVQYIGRRRGRVPVAALSETLAELGLTASAPALAVLPALALINLVPPVEIFSTGELGLG